MSNRYFWSLWGVAVALILTIAIVGPMSESNFWSVAVPGYLTGIGTLALAGTTVYLTRRERQDRQKVEAREQEDRQRLEAAANHQAELERRRQASLCSSWYAGDAPGVFIVFSGEKVSAPDTATSRLALSNRSEEPVYNVLAFLVLVQGAGPTH